MRSLSSVKIGLLAVFCMKSTQIQVRSGLLLSQLAESECDAACVRWFVLSNLMLNGSSGAWRVVANHVHL